MRSLFHTLSGAPVSSTTVFCATNGLLFLSQTAPLGPTALHTYLSVYQRRPRRQDSVDHRGRVTLAGLALVTALGQGQRAPAPAEHARRGAVGIRHLHCQHGRLVWRMILGANERRIGVLEQAIVVGRPRLTLDHAEGRHRQAAAPPAAAARLNAKPRPANATSAANPAATKRRRRHTVHLGTTRADTSAKRRQKARLRAVLASLHRNCAPASVLPDWKWPTLGACCFERCVAPLLASQLLACLCSPAAVVQPPSPAKTQAASSASQRAERAAPAASCTIPRQGRRHRTLGPGTSRARRSRKPARAGVRRRKLV